VNVGYKGAKFSDGLRKIGGPSERKGDKESYLR